MFLLLIHIISLYWSINVPLDHDIHISVCDIYQNKNDDGLELTFKIFYDDLLKAVGLEMGEELPEKYGSADTLINQYIEDHFKLKINGELVSLKYIESVSSPPAVWTTMSINYSEPIRSIYVKNDILTELFDDQRNLVNYQIEKEKSSISFDTKSIDKNIILDPK